jgi:hypothetical protein
MYVPTDCYGHGDGHPRFSPLTFRFDGVCAVSKGWPDIAIPVVSPRVGKPLAANELRRLKFEVRRTWQVSA